MQRGNLDNDDRYYVIPAGIASTANNTQPSTIIYFRNISITMSTSPTLSDMQTRQLIGQVKKFIPPLLERFHKGLFVPRTPPGDKQTNTDMNPKANKVGSQ